MIDWEQRTYEIAKEIFPFASKVTTDILMTGCEVEGVNGKTVMEVCAETALNYADALIDILKKEDGK